MIHTYQNFWNQSCRLPQLWHNYFLGQPNPQKVLFVLGTDRLRFSLKMLICFFVFLFWFWFWLFFYNITETIPNGDRQTAKSGVLSCYTCRLI